MTILHTDTPTRSQVDRLLLARDAASVSIYVPTNPASDGAAERIALKNAANAAVQQLVERGTSRADVAAITEELGSLVDDPDFWRYQARSLGVLASPSSMRTFRLATTLAGEIVDVSDRFLVKPLLRAVAFPQAALILALSQGSVRLVELVADADPFEVSVPDMPGSAADAVGKASITDRSAARRLTGSEGQKVRITQYARQVDQAIRSTVTAAGLPLILVATSPTDELFRAVSSSPELVAQSVNASPEGWSDTDLATAARRVLDDVHAAKLRDVLTTYEQRVGQQRAETDLATLARAATYGMIDTLLVDLDAFVPGTIDADGALVYAETDDARTYGLTDEIARRTWLAGGAVLPIRQDQLPSDTPAAGLLRWAL
jgi:Bacterial archaeo-eukaryotic release factor family 11